MKATTSCPHGCDLGSLFFFFSLSRPCQLLRKAGRGQSMHWGGERGGRRGNEKARSLTFAAIGIHWLSLETWRRGRSLQGNRKPAQILRVPPWRLQEGRTGPCRGSGGRCVRLHRPRTAGSRPSIEEACVKPEGLRAEPTIPPSSPRVSETSGRSLGCLSLVLHTSVDGYAWLEAENVIILNRQM